MRKISLKKLPRRRKIQLFVGSFSILVVAAIFSIAYALLTNNVTVTGSAVVRKSKWDIHFDNLQPADITGTAEELSAPEIVDNITISDYAVSLATPGDSISYTFDVVNDGDYNAVISAINMDTPSCHGIGDNALTDADNVCGNIEYTLKYENDGTTVAASNSRVLASQQSETMVLTIKYADNIPAAELPKDDVEITNLSITITYQQSGDAQINLDGSTPKSATYEIGDAIVVNNEIYYVIEQSDYNKDYVVAFKRVSLSFDEVNTYGASIPVSAQNNSGYGGMAFGETNEYDTSDIKVVVDAWALDKFQNNELKEVNGYTARLITYDELVTGLGCTSGECDNSPYSWVRNNYWTMSKSGSTVYRTYSYSNSHPIVAWPLNYLATAENVRPVVNIKKSSIKRFDYYDNSGNGYHKLQYLESNGTQYIDTGFAPNQSTGFEIDFITSNNISSSNYGSIFGARQDSKSMELQLSTYTENADVAKGVLRYGTGEYNAGITKNSEMNISFLNNVYSNNGDVSTNIPSATFQAPVNLTVFALNQNGSITQYGNVKLYYLKLYNGSTLVRYYKPAIDKNRRPCLFDKVSKTCYYNQGTGEFLYG